MKIMLRQYQEKDKIDILRLNKTSVQVLSPMDSNRFSELRKMCALLIIAEQSGSVVGFLMGFTAGANYTSPNYQWFSNNTENFLYIDRIVVSSETRGLGIGKKLYFEAKNWAISKSLNKLVAEIDIEPPNKSSLLFHRKLGFYELATQKIGITKAVSMQRLDIS